MEKRKHGRLACDKYMMGKEEDHYEFKVIIDRQPFQPGHRTDIDELKEIIDNGGNRWDCYQHNFSTTVRCFRALDDYKALVDRKRARQITPVQPQVIVYVGESGSGKSWHCFTDEDYQEDGYKFPMQMDSKVYFDGYLGEKTIWFDEFCGRTMPFGKWCELVDKYPNTVENKGGSSFIWGLKKILISTVAYPANWWPNSDRFLAKPQQLWRRISKCFYLGKPRTTPDGTVEYAIPLEIDPSKLLTLADEEKYRQLVQYPSDFFVGGCWFVFICVIS